MRKNLFFTAFILILVVAAVWVVEFFYLPKTRHMPRDHYLMGWIGYPDNQIDDTVLNSLGLTGDVPTLSGAKSKESREAPMRILTLGGSALFNRRFTERLKTALDAATVAEFEVVGAAYRGHTSRSSAIKYSFFAKRYDFDLVLIYHGINEAWANNVAPEEYQNDYGHLSAWYDRNWILDHSILARDLYNRFFYRQPKRKEGLSAFRSTDSFRANLEAIILQTLENGSVPLLVTFATCVPPDYSLSAFLAGEVSYNNPERYDPQAIEGWGPKDQVLESIERTNEVTRNLSRQYGVPLLDAAVIFGSDPVDFGDVCHFSEPGTDRFARLMAAFIAEHSSPGIESASSPSGPGS